MVAKLTRLQGEIGYTKLTRNNTYVPFAASLVDEPPADSLMGEDSGVAMETR